MLMHLRSLSALMKKAARGGALQGEARGGGSAKRRRMTDAPARNGEVEEVREAMKGGLVKRRSLH